MCIDHKSTLRFIPCNNIPFETKKTNYKPHIRYTDVFNLFSSEFMSLNFSKIWLLFYVMFSIGVTDRTVRSTHFRCKSSGEFVAYWNLDLIYLWIEILVRVEKKTSTNIYNCLFKAFIYITIKHSSTIDKCHISVYAFSRPLFFLIIRFFLFISLICNLRIQNGLSKRKHTFIDFEHSNQVESIVDL